MNAASSYTKNRGGGLCALPPMYGVAQNRPCEEGLTMAMYGGPNIQIAIFFSRSTRCFHSVKSVDTPAIGAFISTPHAKMIPDPPPYCLISLILNSLLSRIINISVWILRQYGVLDLNKKSRRPLERFRTNIVD